MRNRFDPAKLPASSALTDVSAPFSITARYSEISASSMSSKPPAPKAISASTGIADANAPALRGQSSRKRCGRFIGASAKRLKPARNKRREGVACQTRQALYSGVAILSLLAAVPAAGQSAAPESSAASLTAKTVSKKATANTPAGLEEVVVTAQRRREKVQTVPISVTVLKGKELEQSGYRSTTDLQYVASGVQYDPANGGAFQIRGVGTEAFDPSAEQSVSIVVDDVVIDAPRDLGVSALNDINRVEVLKGPQGTLFGKNATSGVISINTALPQLGTWSETINADYGTRLDRYVTDTLNAPIGNVTALRVTAFEQGQDGFGQNVYNDKTVGTFRDEGARARLLSEPVEGLRIVLNGDYEHHYDNDPAFLVTGSAAENAASEALGATPGKYNDKTADPYEDLETTESYGGSLHIDYQLAGHTITSITSYRKTDFSNSGPVDFVPSPLYLPVNNGTIDSEKVSQELRIASPTGQFLEYIAGFYYNHLSIDGTQVQYGDVGVPLPPGVFLTISGAAGANENLTHTVLDSKAGFGQIKLNFTKQLSLSVGGRYTNDDNSQNLGFGKVQAPYVLINALGPPLHSSGEAIHSNFSYAIHPQYMIAPNIMAYFTYATGYKAPGVAFIDNIYDPFKAETAKDYEAGVKSELLDHRLRLNIDLFRESYTNFQAQVLVPQPVGPPAYVTGNAGGLRSQGVEIQLAVRPIADLSLGVEATYADSVFTNYQDGANNYTGRPLTNAPRWSLAFSSDYSYPILDRYKFIAHVNYSFKSDVYTQVAQAYSVVPGFGLLGGRIGIAPDDGPWAIGIYARNLLNQRFNSALETANGIFRITNYQAYRTVGAYLSYRF